MTFSELAQLIATMQPWQCGEQVTVWLANYESPVPVALDFSAPDHTETGDFAAEETPYLYG